VHRQLKDSCTRALLMIKPHLIVLTTALNCLLATPQLSYSQTVSITIDTSAPIDTSRFRPGVSIIDNTLDAATKTLIKNGISYVNTFIMAWVAGIPGPIPLQRSRPIGRTSMIT